MNVLDLKNTNTNDWPLHACTVHSTLAPHLKPRLFFRKPSGSAPDIIVDLVNEHLTTCEAHIKSSPVALNEGNGKTLWEWRGGTIEAGHFSKAQYRARLVSSEWVRGYSSIWDSRISMGKSKERKCWCAHYSQIRFLPFLEVVLEKPGDGNIRWTSCFLCWWLKTIKTDVDKCSWKGD